MRSIAIVIATTCVAVFGSVVHAEEKSAFRTDENSDESLPWFQPVPGQFPPENSAHYISGELIGVDFPERKLTLRVDRDDSQPRALMDYPVDATMLPYGSVYYNGAPAALQDIPLGTHLHGWFYERPEGEEKHWTLRNGKPHNVNDQRASPEVDFTRCLRVEDDFSYYARQNQVWKIDQVDLEKNKLTATLQQEDRSIGDPKLFDLTSSTVVYRGDGFGTLQSIEPGQTVQLNVTWATLYGPGRVFHIWLDEESRTLASERQLQRHRNHVRERGVPGWVDAVDDKEQIVTITFFDGIDLTLFEDFGIIVPEPLGWPTSGGAKDDLAPKGTIAVARECLMTYDPVNDRKGGNILATNRVPIRPGCSGVQIQVQCGMLLEGYRPTKIVRFFPASWPVIAIPREEQFHGRE
ncbi:hypothetical protein Poly24_03420 [Rosistilla carotiformis]|uniref:Uncharacterized protein n=1 Tax=Rosistilla carotiformis TaxID=2528017 RepID=A0A518JM76_9BACT|nr:hypothetical protein [Rosistilla carotiformis]QDV66655.1 hypothetical protein Poly24_03420 [Rosistilla carotiformis]